MKKGTQYVLTNCLLDGGRSNTLVIKVNPNNPEAYKNRGNAYRNNGQDDEAIADYSRAIQINPMYWNAYYNLGSVYFEKGDFDKSMLNFTKVIEINPKNKRGLLDAYNNRGNIYDKQGDFTQALYNYDKDIEIDPNYESAYYNLGIDYAKQGNYIQAISDFTKVIELNPKEEKSYFYRGVSYCEMKEYGECIEDSTQAIKINSKNAEYYNLRAGAYQLEGDNKKAKDDWRRAERLGFKLDPEIQAMLNQSTVGENEGADNLSMQEQQASPKMPYWLWRIVKGFFYLIATVIIVVILVVVFEKIHSFLVERGFWNPNLSKSEIEKKQLLGLIGSVVLFIGVFMPFLSIPVMGDMNYFHNGQADGVIILILSAVSFIIILTKKFENLLFTGLGSLGVLAFTFINLQIRLSEVKTQMQGDLADNPFSGLADMALQSVQLQWGFALLIIGAIMLIISSVIRE